MADSKAVRCTSEQVDGSTLVTIAGEIDYNSSSELRNSIKKAIDACQTKLIIDLVGVPYMDSSGVAVLVEALQNTTRKKQKLVLCNLQPKVQGIFEIARLNMVFKIVPDVAAAKAF